MSTVKQIEAAIPNLSLAEVEELRSWLEKYFQSLQESNVRSAKIHRSVSGITPVSGKWIGERVLKSGDLAEEMYGAE